MKDRKKKTRRETAGLTPLNPELAAALEEQVARLKAALAAEENLENLREAVVPCPDDLLWDLHLLRELAQIPHKAIPPLLAALFAQSADKVRRKALKRALHTLKTKGVPVPPDLLPREEAVQVTPASTLAPAFTAYLSPIYRDGERYVILEGPREILKGNFLVARVSDQTGLRECHVLLLSRKQRHKIWEEFRADGLKDWVECPPAYALRLLEEALALTPDGEPTREEYLPLREPLWRHLGRPEKAPTLESLLPPLDPGKSGLTPEEARRLAADPLFLPWRPTVSEIEPWFDKLEEIHHSPLILADHQKRQREADLLEAATRSCFPPGTRPRWARRLLEMAYFLHINGRPEETQLLMLAAQDLLAGEPSPLKGENLFLLELTRQSLWLLMDFREKKTEAETSSILAPPTTPIIFGR